MHVDNFYNKTREPLLPLVAEPPAPAFTWL